MPFKPELLVRAKSLAPFTPRETKATLVCWLVATSSSYGRRVVSSAVQQHFDISSKDRLRLAGGYPQTSSEGFRNCDTVS